VSTLGRARATFLRAGKAIFSKIESVGARDRSVSEKITTTAPKYGRFSAFGTLKTQKQADLGPELVGFPADGPYFRKTKHSRTLTDHSLTLIDHSCSRIDHSLALIPYSRPLIAFPLSRGGTALPNTPAGMADSNCR
jgi:hypothetical protein